MVALIFSVLSRALLIGVLVAFGPAALAQDYTPRHVLTYNSFSYFGNYTGLQYAYTLPSKDRVEIGGGLVSTGDNWRNATGSYVELAYQWNVFNTPPEWKYVGLSVYLRPHLTIGKGARDQNTSYYFYLGQEARYERNEFNYRAIRLDYVLEYRIARHIVCQLSGGLGYTDIDATLGARRTNYLYTMFAMNGFTVAGNVRVGVMF